MSNLNKEALDRHITGNYGEDQFKGDHDPLIYCMCGEDSEVELKPDTKHVVHSEVDSYHGNCPLCNRIWTVRCSGSHPEEGG